MFHVAAAGLRASHYRVIYLSGATGAYLENGTADALSVGLMIQPGNSYYLRVAKYAHGWAADNGAFTSKGGFDPASFRKMLARHELRSAADSCRFVAAPDVLRVHADGTVVGDASATLEAFPAWANEIRTYGLPVALVAQDGLELLLADAPWSTVDVLFLGGSTEWKTSAAARVCVNRALSEGKSVHMGRVNSYKRLLLAQQWGCASADGTFLAFGPKTNLPRLAEWVRKLREHEERGGVA
jgi:hypothetical protein